MLPAWNGWSSLDLSCKSQQSLGCGMSSHLRERPLFLPEVPGISYRRWPLRTRLKSLHRRTVVEDASTESHPLTASTSKHIVGNKQAHSVASMCSVVSAGCCYTLTHFHYLLCASF